MTEDSLVNRVKNSELPSSDSENNLEEIVKKHKPRSFIGKIFDYTIAAASVFASYSLIGPIALVANAIAFVGDRIINFRRKRDTPSRQTRNSAIMASLMSIPGKLGFDLMNKYINVKPLSGWLLRGAVQLFGYQPIMGVTSSTIAYPLANKTFKGIYERGYKVWWRNYKDNLKYFALPKMLTARYMPPQTHFPINLGLDTSRRVIFGERYLKAQEPYLYEHKKIKGQSIDELIKKYQAPKTNNQQYKKAA